MHVNMIISEPAIKIKRNINIAVYCLKSQTTRHGDFMYVFLGSSMLDVRLFSPCTDSSHELQHFMFEQIYLHVFKAVIKDYSCLFV